MYMHRIWSYWSLLCHRLSWCPGLLVGCWWAGLLTYFLQVSKHFASSHMLFKLNTFGKCSGWISVKNTPIDTESGFSVVHQEMDPFRIELPQCCWSHCMTAVLIFCSGPNLWPLALWGQTHKHVSFKDYTLRMNYGLSMKGIGHNSPQKTLTVFNFPQKFSSVHTQI